MDTGRSHIAGHLYGPPDKSLWTGRATDPKSNPQYWYQIVELHDWNKSSIETDSTQKNIALIGYACDEGVNRNQGRVGARFGPQMIRKSLAKLPIHFDGKRVIDVGDIVCEDSDMEASQAQFSASILELLQRGIFPIGLGGGHDMAYGHFKGIRSAIESEQKIGIINFDAHFDLRPVDELGNSGTPFNQINSDLNKENLSFDYFVIGIQQQANTRELFQIVNDKGVGFVFIHDCEPSNIELIKEKLKPIITNNEKLYITIDLDSFSSAYAPGVSAPSALGFNPSFAFEVLAYLFATNKVVACDIAELNPAYDRDNMTGRLAAMLVDFVVSCY